MPRVITSAGTLAKATSAPLMRPRKPPKMMHEQEHDDDRDAGQVDEQPTGQVGGQAEDRADRQVDVAGDDDDRLADGDEHEDRRREQQVAPAVGAEQEVRVLGRRHDDDEDEGEEDAGLAGLEQGPCAAGDAVGLLRRCCRRGGGDGGHESCSDAWVAANMTVSARGIRAVDLGGDASLAHDQHAVGHAEHLRQLRRDHEDGQALARRAPRAGGAPRPSCRRRCRGSARR